MMQHQMRALLFNDYGPLPAQQAAAAAQHPMLAPRPIDAATMGYHNFPPSDSASPGPSQTINASQFYYPTPSVQVPQAWPAHPEEQDGQGRIPSTAVNYSQYQNCQTLAASDEESSQYMQKEHKQEADSQYPQPITDGANIPGQEYASASMPPNTGNSQWDMNNENNLYSQVCIISQIGVSKSRC